MKNIVKLILSLVLVFSVASCSDDFFDVNRPSGAQNLDDLRMNDFLAPAIYHTALAQYYAGRSFGNYVQYFTGQGGAAIYGSSNAAAWSRIYLHVLPDLKVIRDKAGEVGAIHYDAVAKILTAMNIGLAADSWDWVPYTEASQGLNGNLQPAYDSPESIYAAVDSLLEEAINQLNAEDNSGFSLGNEDIVYGGDFDQWKKLAYTLRARYALHLTKKNGVSAANLALTYLQNGFTSNDDDFEVTFEEKHMNPWYVREVKQRLTSNAHDKIGDQLVSYMNGTLYPFAGALSLDPRLEVIAEKDDPEAPYRGFVTGGDGISSDGEEANTNFKDGGFYTNLSAPVTVISYAEALFIKAEASFLTNGGNTTSTGTNATAYDAYLSGISANMDKLGVDGSEYLADASIDMGAANLRLEHIMKEKYIADFLNPETYNDVRRYGFSTDVFKGLELPLDNAESEYPGHFMLRVSYPSTEETRNPTNVAAHKQAPIVPVWWAE